MLEFSECMRDHGIDMPDPQFEGEGGGGGMIEMTADPDNEGFQEAQEACQPILEGAMGEIELDPEQEAELRGSLPRVCRVHARPRHRHARPRVR